jgi:hypothetical protein
MDAQRLPDSGCRREATASTIVGNVIAVFAAPFRATVASRASFLCSLAALLACILVCVGLFKSDQHVLGVDSSPSAATAARDGLSRIEIFSRVDRRTSLSLQRIELGQTYQNDLLRRAITLVNRGPDSVTINSVESSCECLAVRGIPPYLAAGDEALVELTFDGKREPDFQGSLAINVSCRSATQRVVDFVVCLRVVPLSREKQIAGRSARAVHSSVKWLATYTSEVALFDPKQAESSDSYTHALRPFKSCKGEHKCQSC